MLDFSKKNITKPGHRSFEDSSRTSLASVIAPNRTRGDQLPTWRKSFTSAEPTGGVHRASPYFAGPSGPDVFHQLTELNPDQRGALYTRTPYCFLVRTTRRRQMHQVPVIHDSIILDRTIRCIRRTARSHYKVCFYFRKECGSTCGSNRDLLNLRFSSRFDTVLLQVKHQVLWVFTWRIPGRSGGPSGRSKR